MSHRGLSLRTFLHAVPWELMNRYAERIPSDRRPPPWALLNLPAFDDFVRSRKNAIAAAEMLEDFRRINDICAQGASIVIRACQAAGIEPGNAKPQALGMRIFLDHPTEFEEAWARYLLFSSKFRVSEYRLPAEVAMSSTAIELFREDLQRYFESLAKGDTCLVRTHEDDGKTILFISRGSYVKTLPHFREDHTIGIATLRPASEDFLVYDPAHQALRIRTSLLKDRTKYLSAFAEHFSGDADLAQIAAEDLLYTLVPITEGLFDFGAHGEITSIELTKITVRLPLPIETIVEIKSGDIRRSLEAWGGLRIADAELLKARFRYHLQPEGSPSAEVMFDLDPPATTDLAQQRYADIIVRDLEEQGVKLI